MFWKKKQTEKAPVSPGATSAAGVATAESKKREPLKPEAGKTKVEKLTGPRPISVLVGKYLTAEYKINADVVQFLKAVVLRVPPTEKTFKCRIFDPSEAQAKEIQIKDYTSLDSHPELILYEGQFDEDSKRVELTEKRKVNYDVPLFTQAEILQKIEELREPGSSVFFYQAAGPTHGGPLGMGAAIIELNPNYTDKKGRKYIVYTANVVDMQPVGKGQKLYDSDKPKEIAQWVAQGHHKRTY